MAELARGARPLSATKPDPYSDPRPLDDLNDPSGPASEQLAAPRLRSGDYAEANERRELNPSAPSPRSGIDPGSMGPDPRIAPAARADAQPPVSAPSHVVPGLPRDGAAGTRAQPAAATSGVPMATRSPVKAPGATSRLAPIGPVLPIYVALADGQVHPIPLAHGVGLETGSGPGSTPGAASRGSPPARVRGDRQGSGALVGDRPPRDGGLGSDACETVSQREPAQPETPEPLPIAREPQPPTQRQSLQGHTSAQTEHVEVKARTQNPLGSPLREGSALRPLLPAAPLRGRPLPQPEPTTVQITIGRIEVRAVNPPTPTPKPKAVPKVMTLEEYLRRRGEGRP